MAVSMDTHIRNVIRLSLLDSEPKKASTEAAIAAGRHAARIKWSLRDLQKWMQSNYGKIWVVETGMHPGLDYRQILKIATESFKKSGGLLSTGSAGPKFKKFMKLKNGDMIPVGTEVIGVKYISPPSGVPGYLAQIWLNYKSTRQDYTKKPVSLAPQDLERYFLDKTLPRVSKWGVATGSVCVDCIEIDTALASSGDFYDKDLKDPAVKCEIQQCTSRWQGKSKDAQLKRLKEIVTTHHLTVGHALHQAIPGGADLKRFEPDLFEHVALYWLLAREGMKEDELRRAVSTFRTEAKDKTHATRVETDPKIKGKKVVSTGFRTRAPKGMKYTLTGQKRWAYAGRGYEYEMRPDRGGPTIWLDGSGFEVKAGVELFRKEARDKFDRRSRVVSVFSSNTIIKILKALQTAGYEAQLLKKAVTGLFPSTTKAIRFWSKDESKDRVGMKAANVVLRKLGLSMTDRGSVDGVYREDYKSKDGTAYVARLKPYNYVWFS